jgi:hypothetical protein
MPGSAGNAARAHSLVQEQKMLGDYYLKASADIDAMHDEAKAWRRKMEKADSAVMRQYYDEIQSIEDKCDAARIALNACVVGGKHVSEAEKKGLEKAIGEAREALDGFSSQVKRVLGRG